MRGFILAAGLGTRLKPFTLENPKALVPVGGIPMLERVILRMKDEGIQEIIINIHHFGEKIIDFLKEKDDFGLNIKISDERDLLRDTGGGLLHASRLIEGDDSPLLIHNVDILSDAPLRRLGEEFISNGADAGLIVSRRDSSRQLLFDAEMRLKGWHNLKEDIYKPGSLSKVNGTGLNELAFSGIHIVRPSVIFREMERQSRGKVFSVIDFYLESIGHLDVRGMKCEGLNLIDIGKPATLSQACAIFK